MGPLRLWLEYDPGNEPPNWKRVVAGVVVVLALVALAIVLVLTDSAA